MATFWLTKKVLLEALKMTEGQPQTTMVMFDGRSEIKNGVEQTVMCIDACGMKKTIREDFNKLRLANPDYDYDD